jgi:hypothetical protein
MSDASPNSDPQRDSGAPLPVGNASSLAMVELACAMAIQDAVAYLRNTETIAIAAMGSAQQLVIDGTDVKDATPAMIMAQINVAAAAVIVAEVGIAVTTILRNYPRDLRSREPSEDGEANASSTTEPRPTAPA